MEKVKIILPIYSTLAPRVGKRHYECPGFCSGSGHRILYNEVHFWHAS